MNSQKPWLSWEEAEGSKQIYRNSELELQKLQVIHAN